MESKRVIIVGAGVVGLTCLRHLLAAGIDAEILEKGEEIGGLWRDLPPWQDIQNTPYDWAIDDIPLQDVHQPAVLGYLKTYVEKYGLRKRIRFGEKVHEMTWNGDSWCVLTSHASRVADYVIVCTGPQQYPEYPKVARRDSTAEEFHSSEIRDPEILYGKRVLVVGGGASAYDLLELALKRGAAEIHWLYRSNASLRWMLPTSRPKQKKSDLRRLARDQMLGASPAQISRKVNQVFDAKYRYFGIEAIKPSYPFDIEQHQILPGRALLIQQFSEIKRHLGDLISIAEKTVTTSAENFEADVILYGTGYSLDLSRLGLSKLSEARTSADLHPRCGALSYSLDYPNLFLNLTNGGGSGAAPLGWSYIARSIAAHILGKTQYSKIPELNNVNHWDVIKMLARFDRANYFPVAWRFRYAANAVSNFRKPKKLISVRPLVNRPRPPEERLH